MAFRKNSLTVLIVSISTGVLILLVIFLGIFNPDTRNTAVNPNEEHNSSPPENTPTPTVTPTITPTPTPTPIPVGMPNTIEIPKINVVANIVPIGVTPNYTMEVPKKASDVGWFQEKIKPGQWGAAILVGHYDTPSGRPAIFYHIKKLVAGDEVIILTNLGERFVFKVDKILSQSYKTFPKDLVYGNFTGRELRLITCDGVWNPQEKSYSRRLVVFTKLWQE